MKFKLWAHQSQQVILKCSGCKGWGSNSKEQVTSHWLMTWFCKHSLQTLRSSIHEATYCWIRGWDIIFSVNHYGILLVDQMLHHQLMPNQQKLGRLKLEGPCMLSLITIEDEFVQQIKNAKTLKEAWDTWRWFHLGRIIHNYNLKWVSYVDLLGGDDDQSILLKGKIFV